MAKCTVGTHPTGSVVDGAAQAAPQPTPQPTLPTTSTTTAPPQVFPRSRSIGGVAPRFDLELEPWSLAILRLRTLPPLA